MDTISFKLHEDLSQFKDSMLFDSDTEIATMQCRSEAGDIVTATLCVRGAVRVSYDGCWYKQPSKFPQGLKDLIKAKPNEWDDAENVEVDENNWFEYIYETEDEYDGIVCEDDISELTEDELKAKMQGVCKWVLEEEDDLDDAIYVAVFNHTGDFYDLLRTYEVKAAAKFASTPHQVSLVNGDTLCFRGLSGPEISELMEEGGADYNYSYYTPESAWKKEDDGE